MSASRRKDVADGPSWPSTAPRRRRPRGPLALVSLLFVLFLGVGQITTIAAAEELGNEPAATETEAPAPDGGVTEASTDPTETPAPSESPDATTDSDSTDSTATGDDSTGSAESTDEGSTAPADTTDQESSSAGTSSGTGAIAATQTDEPGPASGDGVQPSLIPGNPTCTDAMGEGAFLFSTKVEPVTDTTVQLSNDGMTGTLTVDVNEGAQTVSFTFSGDFVALGVIVKGGNNANFFDYRPDGDAHDTGLHAPVNPMNGKFYGLSHLEFCIGQGQATETHAHIDVQKTCPDSVQAGSDVEFTITVTNTGTEALTDITVDDSLKGDITDDFDVDLSAGLAVGASATATVTYKPGSDEDPVENTVTATAKGAESDEDASDSASCSTDVQHQTEIDVEKSCPDTVEAGSDVEFTITVTNTGTEALTDITVDDSLKGDITDDFDVDLSAGLAVGASATATVTYTPGSDEDPVENTVTATGTGVDSQSTDSDTASCETDVTHVATIDVEKSCPDTVEADGTITYTITVENTGTEALTDISVDDSLLGDITADFDVDLSAGLAVGVTATATVTHTPGPDEDPVVNTVTATGTGVDSQATDSDSATCETDVTHVATIDVEKSCPDTVEANGMIEYTITVTNTGTDALTDITVDDSLLGDITADFDVDLSLGLAAGASATATVTHQAPESGSVTNTVTATATGVDSQTTDSDMATCETDVTPPAEGPAIQIVKGGPAVVHRGETITYQFEVTNTGDVELFDVDLTDPRCDTGTIQAGVDVDSSLAVGEVWHFTCTHLVTEADPNPIPNTVTVRGDTQQGEGGTEVTDTDSHVVVVITPDISIDKSVSDVSVTPGTTVTYTYVVTNTGDTTLFDISVDDDVLGHIGDIPMLGVSASQTLTATFTVGDSPVTNTGTASGQDVLGKTVTASDTISVTVVSGGGTGGAGGGTGSGGGVLGAGGSAGSTGGTAFTGSDVWTWAAIAAALALIGAAVLAATRRGRRAEGSIE